MKLATLACTAALLAAASTVARADETGTTADHRDASTAMVLSAGGAALSVGLFAAGVEHDDSSLAMAGLLSVIVTPSLGHWYAGESGGVGVAIRAGGIVMMFVGAVQSICLGDSDDSCNADNAGALMAIGGAALVGGIIYDIGTAPSAVERYNANHSYSLGPTMVSTGGAPTAGFGISGSF